MCIGGSKGSRRMEGVSLGYTIHRRRNESKEEKRETLLPLPAMET